MSVDSTRRQRLLKALMGLPRDADQLSDIDLFRFFLPLWVHGRALEEDVMVVRGDRGAGKSMLFKLLSKAEAHPGLVTQLFPDARIPAAPQWVEGFSSHIEHPNVDSVTQFAQKEIGALRHFWLIHLVGRLTENLHNSLSPPQGLLSSWQADRHNTVAWGMPTSTSISDVMRYLDAVETWCRAENKQVFVTYDHLDHIGITDRTAREKASASLLLMWLPLSIRYRNLRAKIFLREDLFEASMTAGADASKLKARSVRLTWEADSLYRMLLRAMANQDDDLRIWLNEGRFGIPCEEKGKLGWFPPENLPVSGRFSQKGFAEHLVGKYMGANPNKGQVYTWLINKLEDAHRTVAPRSLLDLVANAAEVAHPNPKARHSHLLAHQELTKALEQTSRRRAQEMQEEHKLVARLEGLRGMQVPMKTKDLRKQLRPVKDDPFPDLSPLDAAEELLRIGVLRVRGSDRLDVPDIYRHGFGIKRKGGTART